MQKKVSFILAGLYLFPWGIQCLVNNFLPVYVASLPFATEKTVGEITAIGAVVTMVSQLIWTNVAGRVKNKCNPLALSLLLLAGFALLFLLEVNKLMLVLFVVLFYSCYMTHQPLIDTIVAEKHSQTGRSFGFFRSFASLGFAVFGLVYTVLPSEPPSVFFVYVAILALVSAVLSKLIKAPRIAVKEENKEKSENCMNRDFILFLIYSFLLLMGSRMFSSFFSVYYSTDMGLNGSVKMFSLIISLSTVGEWLIMLLLGNKIAKLGSKLIFIITAVMGAGASLVIFAVQNEYLMFLIIIPWSLLYGFLWSSSTPYMKKIVPDGGFSSAQGIWTVAAFGIAPFVGSYLGGVFAEGFGLRSLFLVVAVLFLSLAVLTPMLIKNVKISD